MGVKSTRIERANGFLANARRSLCEPNMKSDQVCGTVDAGEALRVYRINAVNKERRAIVLGTADRASLALVHLRNALEDYPRAWVTDEQNRDVALPDLMRMAEEEQKGGSEAS